MNREADCLSRAPLDIAKYMDLCTKEACMSDISAIVSNSKHQKSHTYIFINKVAVEKSFVEIENQFMDVKQRGGPAKIRSYWKPDVHIAVEVNGETGLVYAIPSEKDKSGKVRVVHRNHLLPRSSLPLEFPTELLKPRKTRTISKKKVVAKKVENVDDTDSDEDVKVSVANKPTENASEDFNSNDASVCDDDVESL